MMLLPVSIYVSLAFLSLSAVKSKAWASSRRPSEANACWIQSVCHQTVFIHPSENSVDGGQVVEDTGEPTVFKTDQLSWAFVSDFLKKNTRHYARTVVSYTAINTMWNNRSWSAQTRGKAQLNRLNLKILSSLNWLWHEGQKLHVIKGQKKVSERVGDQLKGCGIKPRVS